METIYKLSKDGVIVFLGTENDCYFKLQRSQSQSADWAIKYEGWKVQPFEQYKAFKNWVLTSIDLEDYGLQNMASNILKVAAKEKINTQKTTRNSFIDWLQGEPSTFASTTVYNENVALLIKLGIETPNSATYSEEMEMLQGMIYNTLVILKSKELQEIE